MSHEGQENQGTELRDVFDILVKEPLERLLSLTFQLGESPEDNIIHALCLIILKKEAQALNKLQMLKDNYLAKHLAKRWQMSGGKLEDFGVHCGNFQEFTGESLAALARIFKILSERRLCDPLLRNLAYQRALSTDSQKTSNCEDVEYDQLREEAKLVCGPQFEEWICSSKDLKSGSYHDSHRNLEGVNTTLKMTDHSGRANLPSPLQASFSLPSYPTHLEISMPPTVPFQGGKITPETSDKSKLNTCVLLAPGQSQSPEEPQPKSSEPALPKANKDSKIDGAMAAECRKLVGLDIQNETPNQAIKPSAKSKCTLPIATNASLPKVLAACEMHKTKDAEEEEEEIFYGFVILHAQEDIDMAESMKEKLEKVTGCQGATYTEDFAIPGRSTLRCVEDAINNSAYTLLLLTRNFNTRMVEMETDSALINSMNKKYKHNTVIPVLPQTNSMPRQSIPTVLQTVIPLEENRNFERKAQRALSAANIARQKKIWTEGQRVKREIERQDKLKLLNQSQKQLMQESKIAESLAREHLNLLMKQKLLLDPGVPPEQGGGDGRAGWPQQQQPSNIHIDHAQYIIIGNDSKMTVSTGKDDSVHSDEEQ